MKIELDENFWYDENDDRSRVFQVFPQVFGDDRGSFIETWKSVNGNLPDELKKFPWFSQNGWIKQMNVSYSRSSVIRGCHAQGGASCQAKLVSSLNGNIWDIITDARPQSETFMMTKVYFLNPRLQNKLFVPRGFLHAFLTGIDLKDDQKYIFSYICDNVYDKTSEIGVFPLNIVLPAFSKYCEKYGLENFITNGNSPITSTRDTKGQDADDFFKLVKEEYNKNSTLWYR